METTTETTSAAFSCSFPTLPSQIRFSKLIIATSALILLLHAIIQLLMPVPPLHTNIIKLVDAATIRKTLIPTLPSSSSSLPLLVVTALVITATIILLFLKHRRRSGAGVYLLDFACYMGPETLKCNYEMSEYLTRNTNNFTIPSVEFQRRVFLRSGLGDETYVPPFIAEGKQRATLDAAWEEADMVMSQCLDNLLAKTNVKPSQIDILITNCSLFNPTPSLADMLVQKYGMRDDIKAVHLGGMGCSASAIACTLAHDLLKIYPNKNLLIVSTESITNNWYSGNQKTMLITNCLFRLGCAAILMTNKPELRHRCGYQLLSYVRTHIGASDKAYYCAYEKEDSTGAASACELTKDLMSVAAEALRSNIVTLAPSILPISELLKYAGSMVFRTVLKLAVKQYQPDFKLAVNHFCIHAGGRAVIDEMQKSLHLNDYLLEPSRASLHRFGNTSASCLWYVFSYMEAKKRIKKGDKVWMVGLGTGFKCISLIWKAVSDVDQRMPSFTNPWRECIHRYPQCIEATTLQRKALIL